jgi:hypothetical protein
VEPLIVELCIEKALMGQPLSLLVNSIIKGTIYQANLRWFQIDALKMSSEADKTSALLDIHTIEISKRGTRTS